MQGDGGGVGVVEHHLVFGAPRQDLGDDVPEPGEHLVPGGVQHHAVERDVVLQIVVELMAARGADHAEGRRGEVGAVLRRGQGGGQSGRHRLDGGAQHGEGAQLPGPVGTGQPPADHPRVVDVPRVGRADRDTDPAAGLDQVHRLQHADDLAHHGAGGVEPFGDLVGAQDAAGRVLPRGDREADRLQHVGVEALAGTAFGAFGGHGASVR